MGQNFLKSVPALNMMCEASTLTDKDTVLEIGPGKGALTSYLLKQAKQVVAIEKDRELIGILEEKFAEEIKNKKFILINEDVLSIEPKDYGLKEGEYKIIANIPYNITGAILKRFLSETTRPQSMTLLVQKEVAERIVARDGKESILSLSVKAYGTPKYMMKVAKRFFSPEPKVDSAIISINDISLKNFKDKKEEERFFDVIKSGFAHKRKVLRNNLESLDMKQEQIDKIFKELNINSMTRAENVKLPVWVEISKSI